MTTPHQNITTTASTGLDEFDRIRRFEVIDDHMAAVLRQKSDAERLRSVDAFWNSARAILRASICTEHPDWDSQAISREIARRISNGAIDDVLG